MLEWAHVNGVARRAEEFVGVATSHRPAGLCPCCGEAIVWKAGDVKVPHVAHRADSACAATNPETAAHLNAKAKLAALFERQSLVLIAGACSRRHAVATPWAVPAWNRALPEYRLGTRRPDVALLDKSMTGVAAVEVLHTHAVDEAKAADLAAAGLPWIEVHSRAALEWDTKSPLQIAAADAVTLAGFDAACGACAEHRAWVERRAAEQAEINARWEAAAPERALRALRAAEEAKADKERKRRAFEKAVAQADFDHACSTARNAVSRIFAKLDSDPKCLRIAAYGGCPYRRHYVVGAMVMHAGAQPRAVQAPCVGPDAHWLAIDYALAWLEQSAPGRSAIIYASDEYIDVGVHSSWGGNDEVQQRVRAAARRTGSVVIRDPEISCDWAEIIQDYAVSTIWESEIEESDPHVPLRWASWWNAWADTQRHEVDSLEAGFARALELDGAAS